MSAYTGKIVDQLLYHTIKLYNQLRDDKMPQITRAPVFREKSSLKLENFDYYAYSPAGPIVPPIDVSWASHPVVKYSQALPTHIISPYDTPSPVFQLKKDSNLKLPAISRNKKGSKKDVKSNPTNLPHFFKKQKIQIAFGKRTIVQ